MNSIDAQPDNMMKFTDEEKMWINKLFRFLYGHKEVRRKNRNLMIKTYMDDDSNVLETIKKPKMRKLIHFIRNEIIPINAAKVVYAIDLKFLPESYKKGCFWLDATSQGYKATTDIESIDKHIETLQSRCRQIGEDIESARLVIKALKRLEGK